jgi:hypothetical protein
MKNILKKVIIIGIMAFLCVDCGTTTQDTGIITKENTPQWIISRVNEYQRLPPGNPSYSIVEYIYEGQRVFYFPPQCCDQRSELYDVEGHIICAPDGGFTGRGDGKCPNFLKKATNEILIWKDRR